MLISFLLYDFMTLNKWINLIQLEHGNKTVFAMGVIFFFLRIKGDYSYKSCSIPC